MSINKRSVVMMVLFSAYSFNASSAEMNAGTIHFTGEIIEPSCTIQGDSGSDINVKLGTWPNSLFTDVGVETDLTPFTITLADCPKSSEGLPAVQLTFNGPTALTKSKTLLDVSQITTTGDATATGVGIAISSEGSNTELLSLDGSEEQVYITLPSDTIDTVYANFNARYKSFSKTVTAGAADADLTVNILYR